MLVFEGNESRANELRGAQILIFVGISIALAHSDLNAIEEVNFFWDASVGFLINLIFVQILPSICLVFIHHFLPYGVYPLNP